MGSLRGALFYCGRMVVGGNMTAIVEVVGKVAAVTVVEMTAEVEVIAMVGLVEE